MANLVQIYDIELLASDTVEHTALVIEEDDLQRLKLFCQLTSGDVRIDVEDLARIGFGETGEDGQSTCTDRGFYGALVDFGDFAYKAILVLIKVVCGKDTGGDRTGASAQLFKRSDELEVLVKEDATSDLKSFRV